MDYYDTISEGYEELHKEEQLKKIKLIKKFLKPKPTNVVITGKKGKKAELIGNECSNELIKTIKSKAPVDKYLADNLIPFLAIFGGKIKVEEVSEHTLANIKTCELFLDKKFEIKNNFIRLQTQSN